MQPPVFLHNIKIDTKQWTKTYLNCQNPVSKEIVVAAMFLLWAGFCFLKVNHQIHAGMVSTNNV